MANCYNGSVLHVNLTTGEIVMECPSDEIYRMYGGGSGIGMYYILRDMPPKVDPLGPENVLTMFTGPLTGLAISGQSRLAVNALSPMGKAIGDSQCGGFFPAAMKHSGFDGVVLYGQSPNPVYLFLDEGKAELCDAAELWGKDTAEVDLLMEKKYGKVQVLQIGPAGENLVHFAAIMNMHTRACGRTGMGAVMGSKKLKAVVVRGKSKISAANPSEIILHQREGTKNIPNIPELKGLGINGTADGVPFQQAYGTLPSYNFNEGTFDEYMEVSGERMTDTILKERDTCYACTVRCKRVVETIYKDQKVLPTYGGPEYETLCTLGTYCGISDLAAISLGGQLCNQFGLDTISCGATIAFAMECFEKGIINIQDTAGLELRFGNADAMLEAIRQIAFRKGFGATLAEGSAQAAEIIGLNAEEYLITVKGTEAPAHMPQAKKTLSLIYAVNTFGADHQSSEHDPYYEEGVDDFYLQRLSHLGLTTPQPEYSLTDEKLRYAYLTQLFFSALDTYCLCQFVYGPSWELYGPKEMSEILSAATGWDIGLDEIILVGERRLNMMRAFNAREGFTRKDDYLPKKFFKPLEGKGPTSGVAFKEEDLEHSKDVYYRLAGWDMTTGNPTPEKLAELGLEWIE